MRSLNAGLHSSPCFIQPPPHIIACTTVIPSAYWCCLLFPHWFSPLFTSGRQIIWLFRQWHECGPRCSNGRLLHPRLSRSRTWALRQQICVYPLFLLPAEHWEYSKQMVVIIHLKSYPSFSADLIPIVVSGKSACWQDLKLLLSSFWSPSACLDHFSFVIISIQESVIGCLREQPVHVLTTSVFYFLGGGF